MKAFGCWSGGKESALACWRVMHIKNFKIAYLLNMISEDGTHSRSHGLKAALLKSQAEAIGIPIVQRKTTWKNYQYEFKKALLDFKKENIQAGVFGDIDLAEHRDWIEKVCQDMKIKPVLPLWQEERKKLLEEFIRVGFRALIVAANADFLGQEWLGREMTLELIEELAALGNIDLCGEKGEFHTFVYAGPIFQHPIEFNIGDKTLKNKHWFLNIGLNTRR